jgi:hypothetical protein
VTLFSGTIGAGPTLVEGTTAERWSCRELRPEHQRLYREVKQ